ncbi:MAG: hypothetical protein RQ862_10965 [Candidatus Caldarchaeales archaeon]|nr:hypothetical protein [Candidatus Caldarchaeales archaeon]
MTRPALPAMMEKLAQQVMVSSPLVWLAMLVLQILVKVHCLTKRVVRDRPLLLLTNLILQALME